MHVSLSPSVPPRSWVPTRAGDPLYFTPLRPTEVPRFASGSVLKLARLRFVWSVKAGSEKKADRTPVALYFQRKTPMPCRWPVLRTQPNSRCSASSTGAELVSRARFFRLETGPPRGRTRTLVHPRLGPPGASTSPRIWIRSIKGRIFSVKRKTQNVGDDFVLRLFVVVPFPRNHFFFNTFTLRASHATLVASNSICDASSPLSPSFFSLLFLSLRKLPRSLFLKLPLPPFPSRLTARKSTSPEFPTLEKSTISCIAARNLGKWDSLS